jgi:manganese/iron transport system permease protein/iron/zinc/copper transport system permease protein
VTALVEPLQYQFFLHGLLAAFLAGSLCGMLGVYIILRKMSYIGHGLAHAVFGGAVVSQVVGVNFYLGAGLWGFGAALLIHAVAAKREINADVAIGVVTTASFAIGVAVMSRVRRYTRDFDAALFGDDLGVSERDIVLLGLVTLLVAAVIVSLYKQLLFSTFDEEVAQVTGVPTRALQLVFALLLALAILASMQVLGVTLIAAAIVMPAATARLLTHNFTTMLLISTALGGLTALLGMYLSYYLDIASGASIVLFAALLFMGVLGSQRLLWRRKPQFGAAGSPGGHHL